MKTRNILLELAKKNSKKAQQNKKKKKATIVFDAVLVVVLIIAVAMLGKAITPHVQEYIEWLNSPLVCLDPGHGGKQIGTDDNGRIEKEDNLKLSLLVRDILEENGVRVCMTRDDDKDINLSDRCKYANNKKAALFVSLHRNQADSDAQGIEIWISKREEEGSIKLANYILDRMMSEPITVNRGVRVGSSTSRNSDYYVLRNTTMPGCLIETGFVNSDEDNKLYDENIKGYAYQIASGIIDTLIDLYPDDVTIQTMR